MVKIGTLFVVATPIGNLSEMTPRAIDILNSVDLIACEDTRVTKNLCHHFNISKPLLSTHEHNEIFSSIKIIEKILEGKNVALVSDAGYPGISDPGNKVIIKAIDCDIKVEVISGPCAIINALVGSGLPSDRFYFHGFLKSKSTDRIKELKTLIDRSETLIFYEAPHRIKDSLEDMALILGKERRACICRELTKKFEEYIRGNLEELIYKASFGLKGEMVVVVEGQTLREQVTISSSEILQEIDSKISKGMSAKDAINEVAKMHNLSKNEVYRLYHQ